MGILHLCWGLRISADQPSIRLAFSTPVVKEETPPSRFNASIKFVHVFPVLGETSVSRAVSRAVS